MINQDFLFAYGFNINQFGCDESTDDSFEIDVQPLKKNFITLEDKQRFIDCYTLKKKTELCKNFTFKGTCRFENSCSFAHGDDELAPKQHLHYKYKTKPCVKYFKEGFCSYGIRCQYVHEEIKDTTNFQDFQDDLLTQNGSLMHVVPVNLRTNVRYDLQRFQQLPKHFPRLKESNENLILTHKPNRINTMKRFSDQLYDLSFLSETGSRKQSQEIQLIEPSI